MSLMGHNERGSRAGQRFCRCALAAVVLAFASGTQEVHVQHHWVDDVLIFEVLPHRFVGNLFHVPMLERELVLGSGTPPATG